MPAGKHAPGLEKGAQVFPNFSFLQNLKQTNNNNNKCFLPNSEFTRIQTSHFPHSTELSFPSENLKCRVNALLSPLGLAHRPRVGPIPFPAFPSLLTASLAPQTLGPLGPLGPAATLPVASYPPQTLSRLHFSSSPSLCPRWLLEKRSCW